LQALSYSFKITVVITLSASTLLMCMFLILGNPGHRHGSTVNKKMGGMLQKIVCNMYSNTRVAESVYFVEGRVLCKVFKQKAS